MSGLLPGRFNPHVRSVVTAYVLVNEAFHWSELGTAALKHSRPNRGCVRKCACVGGSPLFSPPRSSPHAPTAGQSAGNPPPFRKEHDPGGGNKGRVSLVCFTAVCRRLSTQPGQTRALARLACVYGRIGVNDLVRTWPACRPCARRMRAWLIARSCRSPLPPRAARRHAPTNRRTRGQRMHGRPRGQIP